MNELLNYNHRKTRKERMPFMKRRTFLSLMGAAALTSRDVYKRQQVYSRADCGTVVRFELPQTQQPEEKEETLS